MKSLVIGKLPNSTGVKRETFGVSDDEPFKIGGMEVEINGVPFKLKFNVSSLNGGPSKAVIKREIAAECNISVNSTGSNGIDFDKLQSNLIAIYDGDKRISGYSYDKDTLFSVWDYIAKNVGGVHDISEPESPSLLFKHSAGFFRLIVSAERSKIYINYSGFKLTKAEALNRLNEFVNKLFFIRNSANVKTLKAVTL